jgi:hypothetical protein
VVVRASHATQTVDKPGNRGNGEREEAQSEKLKVKESS